MGFMADLSKQANSFTFLKHFRSSLLLQVKTPATGPVAFPGLGFLWVTQELEPFCAGRSQL